MTAPISVKILWTDDDVIELRFVGTNGRFAGEADAYAGHDAIMRLAEGLRGFPSSPTDSRSFEFGARDEQQAGGGVQLRFFCIDGSGHATVHIQLRSDSRRHLSSEIASFNVPVEASALDAFIVQLKQMGLAIGASASLPSAA